MGEIKNREAMIHFIYGISRFILIVRCIHDFNSIPLAIGKGINSFIP